MIRCPPVLVLLLGLAAFACSKNESPGDPGTAGAGGGVAGAGGSVTGAGGSVAGAGGSVTGAGGEVAGAAGATGIAGAGGGASGAGGRGGAGGGSACATAVMNGACSPEGELCGSCGTDICQFCNRLRCTNGHWQQQESAPAPCFDCGTNLRCQTGAKYCQVISGGPVDAGSSYSCQPFPSSCAATPTCTCLGQTPTPPPACFQPDGGGVVVTISAS